MARPPSPAYTVATLLTAIVAIVGVWLPWVQKLPVGYTNGTPYYTSEWVPGLEAGLQGIDIFAVVLAVLVIVAIGVAHRWEWAPDGVLIVAGALLVWWAGTTLRHYWTVEYYAILPGLYLCVTSGLLLVLLGAGGGLRRHLHNTPDTHTDSPT